MGAEAYPLNGTNVALGLFPVSDDEDDVSTEAYSDDDDYIDSDDTLDDISTDVPDDDVVDSDASTEYAISDDTEDETNI